MLKQHVFQVEKKSRKQKKYMDSLAFSFNDKVVANFLKKAPSCICLSYLNQSNLSVNTRNKIWKEDKGALLVAPMHVSIIWRPCVSCATAQRPEVRKPFWPVDTGSTKFAPSRKTLASVAMASRVSWALRFLNLFSFPMQPVSTSPSLCTPNLYLPKGTKLSPHMLHAQATGGRAPCLAAAVFAPLTGYAYQCVWALHAFFACPSSKPSWRKGYIPVGPKRVAV